LSSSLLCETVIISLCKIVNRFKFAKTVGKVWDSLCLAANAKFQRYKKMQTTYRCSYELVMLLFMQCNENTIKIQTPSKLRLPLATVLRMLTTWHCPHSHATRCCCWSPAVQQSIVISSPPDPQQQTCSRGFAAVGPCWNKQNRRKDTVHPAPQSKRAVPITCRSISLSRILHIS